MSPDPATYGALLTAAAALIVGVLFRRAPATVALWLAIITGLFLLGRNPYAAGTLLLAAAAWVVHRYGWRHLLAGGGLAFVFASVTWADIQAGMLLPAALADAAGRTIRFVVLAAAAVWVWQLATRRLGYLAHPAAYAAETRRLQQTAEHRQVMGGMRRGAGWAKDRARRGLVGRRKPATDEPGGVSVTPPGERPRDARGRFLPTKTPDGSPVATVTVPATNEHGIPEPLFAPRPRRRWRQ